MSKYVIEQDQTEDTFFDDLDDANFEQKAREFRANLSAVAALEKTAEAVSVGDIGQFEEAIVATEFSNVSPDLLEDSISRMSDKALLYIMLENDIKRIDAHAILRSVRDRLSMADNLTENMLDQDPRLFAKLVQSFRSFERLVTKFSLFATHPNVVSSQLAQQFYESLIGLGDVVAFFDVNAEYAK